MNYPAPDPLTRDEDATAPALPRRRLSRRAAGWIAGGTAVVLIAAATVTTVVVRADLAAQHYASAARDYTRVATEYNSTVSQRRAAESASASALSLADLFAAAVDPAYVDPAATAAYTASAEKLRAAYAAVDPSTEQERLDEVEPDAAPEGTEEKFEAGDELAREGAELDAERDAQVERLDTLRPLVGDLASAQKALLTAATATGDAIRAANPAASRQKQNELEYALHPNRDDAVSMTSPSGLTAYIAAARAVQESQAAAVAEQAQPEWPAKAEVIAFANSIAGGTPLDVSFTESITIDGEAYGSRDSGAGLATWRTDWDRLGTIRLTNSIYRYWGDSWTAGLVAHEVGHTITSKDGCLALFRAAPFDSDDEKWATAWALSMGYSDGSGTEPYGYPGDDAVAIAAQCR